MNRKSKGLVAMFVIGIGIGCGAVTINDGFESYTVGTSMDGQGGWVVTAETSDSTATVVAGGSAFDGGTGQSVLLDDNDAATANTRLGYVFTATDEGAEFQFDYRPGSNVIQKPLVQVLGTRASDNANVAGVYLVLDNNGTVQSYVVGQGFTDLGVSLSADSWYRITITVHDVSGGTDTYDVKIVDTSFQTVVSVMDLSFANDLSDIKSLYFALNAAGSVSEFSIDNVTTEPELIPEGLIFSDNFEAYTVGLSIGGQGSWAAAGITNDQTANVVLDGTKMVQLDDNLAANNAIAITRSFSATGKLVFEFDYKVVSSAQNPLFQVLGSGGSGGVAVVYLLLDSGGAGVSSFSVAGGIVSYGTVLSSNEWYHVKVTLDDISGAGETYDLTITDSGDAEVLNQTGIPVANDKDVLTTVRFAFNNATTGGDFIIDNVAVSEYVPPVVTSPESSIMSFSVVSSNVLEVVVNTAADVDAYWPETCSDIVLGEWVPVAHSFDGMDPFVVTNLSYSSAAGVTNHAIYIKSDESVAFLRVVGQL